MEELEVLSPYNAERVGQVKTSTWEEVDSWLNTAQELFQKCDSRLPIYQRISILNKLHEILLSRKDKIVNTAILEGGKPRVDTEVEFARALDGIGIAIAELRCFTGANIPMGQTRSSHGKTAFTLREPVGVVFAISAFNHPINLIIHQIVPAIAVGCPVIIRPASKTPLSCLEIVSAFYEAGLSASWLKSIVCSHEVTQRIVRDARLSYFSFIGSSKVGWELRKMLAPGVESSFEHGGAAPVIVCDDADFASVVPRLVKGGYYHAGQVCVSVQRVYVPKLRVREFCDLFVNQTKSLVTGDPRDPKTEVGPIISQSERERVLRVIEEAEKSGGKILCGGKGLPNSCIEPTVILNPGEKSPISTLEVFGPVVAIYEYEKLENAVLRANSLPFCFQASVFSKDINLILRVSRELKATNVIVNDHPAFRVDWMPFGGREESGQGVGGIPYTMREMTFDKMIVLNS